MGKTADIVLDAFRLMDAGRYEALDGLLADDFFMLMGDFKLEGSAGVKALMDGFKVSFPDLSHEIISVVEQGNKVATENVVRATHKETFASELGTFPASGKPVSWTSSAFVTLENGRVKRWVVYLDLMAVHRALGFSPSSDAEAKG